MKAIVASMILLGGIITHAEAQPDNGITPQAVLRAHMKGTDGRLEFENVEEAVLFLRGPAGVNLSESSSMTLEYSKPRHSEPTPSEHRLIHLVMAYSEVDSCGTRHFYGTLAPRKTISAITRFTIHLMDHAGRTCEDSKPTRWQADVRESYDANSLHDSTLHLEGDPDSVSW